jgi:hypothetical protein
MDKKMMALLATNGPLTGEQLSSLTGEQLSWLTGEQLSWLTGEQLASLTGGQLSWLTGWQLSSLTGEQLASLTGEQLSSLTGELKIPEVKNPYLRMLADIEAGKRCHQQSTFGPDDAYPDMNICGTPMCTAGHLVNMAGPDGYALKDRLGYAGAATLIHMKSRPDVPPQNFGNIPQKWALAYIEARAAEEVNSQLA